MTLGQIYAIRQSLPTTKQGEKKNLLNILGTFANNRRLFDEKTLRFAGCAEGTDCRLHVHRQQPRDLVSHIQSPAPCSLERMHADRPRVPHIRVLHGMRDGILLRGKEHRHGKRLPEGPQARRADLPDRPRPQPLPLLSDRAA